MLKRILPVVLVGMLIPLRAHALGEIGWLVVNSGGGSYAMKQLNDEIEAYNTSNPGSPQFPTVDQGASWGGAVGFEMSNRWSFGFGLDRLYADTKASDSSGGLEYNLNANCWRAFGEYGFRPIGTTAVRIGLGAGMIGESGKLIQTSPSSAPLEDKIGGSGPLFEGYAGGDLWLTKMFAIDGAAGYRYAKVPEMKTQTGVFVTGSGDPVGVDFSGPYLRLGVKLVAKGIE
jgi:hypothetical protein